MVGEERVEPRAALESLAERGLTRVTCEGGDALLAQMVHAGALDEVDLTLAPVVAASPRPARPGPALLTGMRLHQLLEDGGFLFARYLRGESGRLGLTSLARLASEHPESLAQPVAPIRIGGVERCLDTEPLIMGVVNLSRDSTYRDSVAVSTDSAIRRARIMHAQGAGVVDLGRSPAPCELHGWGRPTRSRRGSRSSRP